MRFFSRFISFVLLTAALFLPSPAMLAQVREAGAPAAQSPAPSAGSVDEEPVAGQDRNNAGAKNGQRQPATARDAAAANISGTVVDVNGDIVPGASIVLEGASADDRRSAVAGDRGAFQFDGLRAGVPYHVTIEAKGFEEWKSPAVTLNPGQYFLLDNIRMKLPGSVTSVTVYASPVQIATQQVIVEEHQRVFGIFPNFYVTYDVKPVPLTTKLKYRLALRADIDPVTFFGVAFLAAIYQAGDIPNYGQGWGAYGQRVGAGYLDTTTDIFIGGAILPSLLHQDPRYFYQGTGTKKSRLRHAMFSPFVCRGDNGKPQPNYSSMGGDLASGAISNFYYPESNRGPGLVFQGFAVTTGVRMVNGIIQEFLLRKLTPSAREQK